MDDTLRINVVVNNGASSALNSITNSTDKTNTATNKLTQSLKGITTSLASLKVIGVSTATTALGPITKAMNKLKANAKQTSNVFKGLKHNVKTTFDIFKSGAWKHGVSVFDKNGNKMYESAGMSLGKFSLRNLKGNISGVAKSLGILFKSLLPVIAAVTAAIGILAIALGKLAIKVARAGDEIKDNAQKVFMSATAYQEWGYVLEQNGVEISALNTAMRTFAKSVPDGKDINEEFEKTVYTIQSLTSETEKVALATEKFGNRALELMPVFNQSVSDTQNLMKTYRLLGGTMSNELIAKSDVLTDSITAMKAAWKGLGNTLGSLLMPVLTKVVQWLTMAFAYVNIFLKTLFGVKETFGGVNKAASGFSKSMGDAAESAKEIKRTLFGFDELNVLNGDTGSTAAIDTGGISTEMPAILDDEQINKLTKFQDFMAKVRDFCVQAWYTIHDVAVGVFDAIGYVFSNFWTGLVTIVSTVIDSIKTSFNNLKTNVISNWTFISDYFKGLWEDVKTGFSNMWTSVKDAAKGPLNSVIGFLNKVISGINKIKLPNWGILGGAAGKGINIPLIPTLATGGMVGAGQLFIANEAGPELIGSYGNKSAVMNNEQIVDAVARGVASAIGNQNIQLNVDGQKLFDILVNRNNRQVMMTGTSPLMV